MIYLSSFYLSHLPPSHPPSSYPSSYPPSLPPSNPPSYPPSLYSSYPPSLTLILPPPILLTLPPSLLSSIPLFLLPSYLPSHPPSLYSSYPSSIYHSSLFQQGVGQQIIQQHSCCICTLSSRWPPSRQKGTYARFTNSSSHCTYTFIMSSFLTFLYPQTLTASTIIPLQTRKTRTISVNTIVCTFIMSFVPLILFPSLFSFDSVNSYTSYIWHLFIILGAGSHFWAKMA